MATQSVSPAVGSMQRWAARGELPVAKPRTKASGPVAASLKTLPEGWFVMHDVSWPGRPHDTIDHVVIGPGGTFVIDDKAWSGEIALDGTQLRHNGLRRDTAVADAVDAGHAVVRSSPHASPNQVRPVLCLARDAVVTGRSSQIVACTADELATWLVTQPRVLSSREVVQIVVELEDVLAPVAGVGHAEERDVHAPAAPQERRHIAPVSGAEVIKIALVLALFLLLITQPMLVMSLPGHAVDLVTKAG